MTLDNTDYVLPQLRKQLPDRVLYDPETIVDPIGEHTAQNTTDYTFPRWWGMMLKEAHNPNSPVTRQEVEDQRNEWFWEQRAKKQLKRQYDAGMFNYLDELDDGVPFTEGIAAVENNEYQVK